MNSHDWQVYVVEEFVVVLDGHTGTEEHHHLLLAILLEEGEEQEKPLHGGAHNIALKERTIHQRDGPQ